MKYVHKHDQHVTLIVGKNYVVVNKAVHRVVLYQGDRV